MCGCAFVKTMIVRVFVQVNDGWSMVVRGNNEVQGSQWSTKKSMKVQRSQWKYKEVNEVQRSQWKYKEINESTKNSVVVHENNS